MGFNIPNNSSKLNDLAYFIPSTYGNDSKLAAPVIKNAVDGLTSSGGGTVYLPEGTFAIDESVIWRSNVSIKGAGAGKSILKGYGNGFAVIKGLDKTRLDPYTNCNFEDFEINGLSMGNDAAIYNLAEKGVFIQYMRKCNFKNVYIHDSPATALGVDFLDDCVIDNVVAVNGGRLYAINGGLELGGSGIGIGTGAWEHENLKIINSEARDCGNFGIFVEIQLAGDDYKSKGIRIIGCNASGNGEAGICDKGVKGLIVANCNMHDNTKYGYKILNGGEYGRLTNCNIYGNTESGVYYSTNQAANGYRIENNDIYGNGKHGVSLSAPTINLDHAKVTDNRIYNNGATGINVGGLYSNLTITDNEIWDNATASIANYIYGIKIEADITNIKLKNNKVYDSRTAGSKVQDTGIFFNAGYTITDGEIKDNDCRGNKTATFAMNGTLAGTLVAENNHNYNYSNTVTNLTPGSSPWTYTAGRRPEMLYLIGNIATVAINSANVLTGGGSVYLQANQSVVITYTTITSAKVHIV